MTIKPLLTATAMLAVALSTSFVCGQQSAVSNQLSDYYTSGAGTGASVYNAAAAQSLGVDSCCADACSTGCCDQPRFGFRGWVDVGVIGNANDPASRFNGPYNAVDRSNEIMLNQIYLIGERTLPGSGIGLGGRVDLLYGNDFFLAESIGIEKRDDGSARWNGDHYGLAFPQAFVSVGNELLSLQVGHFYSVVGYEGVMAPDNFFYSKAYSYQFAGPFTHWGAQANMKLTRSWNLQLGLTNGWDAFDRVSDDVGFVGKVRYDSPTSGFWTSFALVAGKEASNSAGLPIVDDFTNRTRYSFLVGVPIRCRTEYVFHHWLGFQDGGAVGAPGPDRAHWYGVDQYIYHTINCRWKAGARFEWFRDEDGTRIGLNRAINPNVPPFAGNVFSVALGLNWTPFRNLMMRPELRYDWYDGDSVPLPYDDGNKDNQFLVGFDAIYSF